MGALYYTGQELLEDRKRGKFRGRLSYRDSDNKRRYLTRTLKATGKRAAQAELTALRQEMERKHAESAESSGAGASVSDTFVPVYVAQYIDTKEATKAIEASTISSYRTSLKHIRNAFADTSIKDLCPKDVEEWIASLLETGLSSSMICKAFRLLKQVLNSAIACGAIDKNPLALVNPPKRVNKHQGINSLDATARTALLSKMDTLELSPVLVAAYIALYTGMRRGEICGLQWRDIDTDSRVMWVRRAVGLGEGGAYIKQPKTDKVRDVALPATLAGILARWKERQRGSFATDMATLATDSFVLGDALGFYHPDRLTKDWATLAKLLGVRGTAGRIASFHDLRHTWATMFLASGGDVKTAASNLGHSNAAMTLNIYASADPDAKQRAAEIVERAIRDNGGQKA